MNARIPHEGRRLGKLKPPYPVECCCNGDCRASLDDGAFLHRDLETNKLVIFCEDCSLMVGLRPEPRRFVLVAL